MEWQDHEFIYRQVIDGVSRNDEASLDQFFDEQLIDHNPIPGQSPGRIGFKEWMASARSSFPDLQGTIEDVMVANNNFVVGRVTWHRRQDRPFAGLPATHKTVALTVIHIARFEEGRVVEWWGVADIFGAVRQLGGKVVLE